MAYALTPLLVVVMVVALTFQAALQTDALAGRDAIADSAASIRATLALAFSRACLTAAQQAPGLVADAIPVQLPAGVDAIGGAQCQTLPDGTGRLILASIPSVAGSAGDLDSMLAHSAVWLQVIQPGLAQRLVSGEQVPVPSQLAVGTLVYRVRVDS